MRQGSIAFKAMSSSWVSSKRAFSRSFDFKNASDLDKIASVSAPGRGIVERA